MTDLTVMGLHCHLSSSQTRRVGSAVVALLCLVATVVACDTSPPVARGTVTSPSGAHVGGVDVVAYANDAPTVVTSTNTNGLGQWTLSSARVAPGTYRVRIGGTWWPDATSWADASPVTFTTADPPVLDAMVDPATRLTGSLVQADLTPVAGWPIYASDAQGTMMASSVTDSSGAFRLPLATGAGTYTLHLVDPGGTSHDVGGSTPTPFHVTAGRDLRVGTIVASTARAMDLDSVASAVVGPYVISTTSVASGNGFGGGTIYAPTSTVHAPYGAVVVTPGFLMNQSTMAWYGPRLASQGFVVLTIDTLSSFDQPGARATQMLAALDWLGTSSPVADIVDPTRSALMGWSMGGGGTLDAALRRPTLDAVIALAPYESNTNFSAVKVPTLVVACQADAIAPVAQHAAPMYASLGGSLPRTFLEIAGADHFCVTSSNTNAAQRTVIARQSLGFLQRYVNDDSRYASLLCPAPAVGGVISDSRSGCPF